MCQSKEHKNALEHPCNALFLCFITALKMSIITGHHVEGPNSMWVSSKSAKTYRQFLIFHIISFGRQGKGGSSGSSLQRPI